VTQIRRKRKGTHHHHRSRKSKRQPAKARPRKTGGFNVALRGLATRDQSLTHDVPDSVNVATPGATADQGSTRIVTAQPAGEPGRGTIADLPGSMTQNRPPHITLWAHDPCSIGGHVAAWGQLKVPLSMFGLFNHNSDPVIHFVAGPGPNAVHQTMHCKHDPEHYRRCCELLARRFGLQPDGDAHSHPYMDLDHPSRGDLNRVRSFTGKNVFTRWCDIVATTNDVDATAKNPVVSALCRPAREARE
jgi:hypothetical protein